MTCDPLPATGLFTGVATTLVLAMVFLVVGFVIVLVTRHRRRRLRARSGAAVVAAIVVGMIITLTPAAPAEAISSDCVSADPTLIVTQTSTLEGLAPGVPPIPIAGLVLNTGSDSTDLADVDVEIVSVTASPGAPAGTCSVSDYEIVDPLMPVGRTLGPGGSTTFTGASIAFVSRPTNQDACRQAVVHLLYTANPSSS